MSLYESIEPYKKKKKGFQFPIFGIGNYIE